MDYVDDIFLLITPSSQLWKKGIASTGAFFYLRWWKRITSGLRFNCGDNDVTDKPYSTQLSTQEMHYSLLVTFFYGRVRLGWSAEGCSDSGHAFLCFESLNLIKYFMYKVKLWFDWLINWFWQHDNLSTVILYLEFRESHSLYFHIYILWQLFLKRFFLLCTRSYRIRIIFKENYLTHRWNPNRYHHSISEWTWE